MALLPDGTKPLPEPMVTYYQKGPVMFIWGQFCLRCYSHQSLKFAWNFFKILLKSPRGQWVNAPGHQHSLYWFSIYFMNFLSCEVVNVDVKTLQPKIQLYQIFKAQYQICSPTKEIVWPTTFLHKIESIAMCTSFVKNNKSHGLNASPMELAHQWLNIIMHPLF